MVPSLLSLQPGPRPAFAIHVGCIAEGDTLSEGLGHVIAAGSQLAAVEADETTAIVFSGSHPQTIVGLGAGLPSALGAAGYNVIHAFDNLEGGRETTVFEPIGTSASDEIAASAVGADSLEDAVAKTLAAVSAHLEADASTFFTYTGSSTATHVLVLPASASAAHAEAALRLLPAAVAEQVGVLAIRVLRPWSAAQFALSLPSTVSTLHVYSEPGVDGLLEVVLGTTSEMKKHPRVIAARVPSEARMTAPLWALQIGAAIPSTPSSGTADAPASVSLVPEGSKLIEIWGSDEAKDGAAVPAQLARAFGGTAGSGIDPRLAVEYDNYSQSGIQHASLLLSPTGDHLAQVGPSVAASASPASLVLVQNPSAVFAAFSPLSSENLSSSTQVLIAAPGWTPEEYEVKFDAETKEALWKVFGTQESDPSAPRGGVWSVDVNAVANATGASPSAVSEVAVWLLYLGGAAQPKEVVGIIKSTGNFDDVNDVAGLVEQTRSSLLHVRIPASWETIVEDGESLATESARAADLALEQGLPTQESVTESKAGHGLSVGTGGVAGQAGKDEQGAGANDLRLAADDTRKTVGLVLGDAQSAIKPAKLTGTSVGPNHQKTFVDPAAASATWHDAAKALIFNEAYTTQTDSKRPDLPEENFILTVTENRRLTPLDYDRNVFHMELSTAGTGLKYAVGEALGVHGWNDAQEVTDFIRWYKLDPEELVSLPNRDNAQSAKEQRTVFQAFQQNLDIFGKPPKSFFEELSKVATEKAEKDSLHFIASAEGSSTFKKWSEADTVTYADVLKAFPSARLSLPQLLDKVELIKPRHYSIASSQNFVGDSVHLLVVTVDWQTPGGATRFGQCTRYLAGLAKGDKVMVSVKPSVMKLPPRDTQPVIMAGLGTGAAPFRAFIQERAWQRAKGIDVGPLYYYFGSRYRSKEYLYGYVCLS